MNELVVIAGIERKKPERKIVTMSVLGRLFGTKKNMISAQKKDNGTEQINERLCMAQEQIEQFADTLIQNCHDLAIVRSETVPIPLDKYIHVRDFTQFLVFNCYSRAINALESGSIKESQVNEIFWEYLYFFIHVTDRFAFSIVGDPRRKTLMQELGEFAVMLALQVLYPEEKDLMFEGCMGALNIAASEYSQFPKLIAEGNEGTKDTLFWEFSKKINVIMGSETNPGALVGEELVIVSTLKNLDIKSFLNKIT